MKYVLITLGVILVLAGGGFAWWYFTAGNRPALTYKTEPVAHGDVTAVVAATGTLEPEDVIDVGAQVGGMVREFGTAADGKPVDYGSPVEPGTVLARIDDSLYRARKSQSEAAVQTAKSQAAQAAAKLEQAKAGVEQARANTQRSEADVVQATAKANQAEKDLRRLQAAGRAISQQELDAAQAGFDANTAAVGVAKATLAQTKAAELNAAAAVTDAEAAVSASKAGVATAEAVLKQEELNLGYCTITSEVKGTIIDRRVTLGQTVQSSFNTPSLFLIAKDLKKMKVWASVNEADVGQIRVGQPAKFTVDAHPGRTFKGTVGRIRLNATNTQNVVVYTVEVTTENPDGLLLPYMTANLTFEVDRRTNVTTIPNAALRYKPSTGEKPPPAEKGFNGTVWVKDGAGVRAVPVKTGLTDGNRSEVAADDLPADAELVVSDSGAANKGGGDGGVNPFANRPGGGGGRPKQ